MLLSLPALGSREVSGELTAPPPGSQPFLPQAGTITCPASDPYRAREPVELKWGWGIRERSEEVKSLSRVLFFATP